MAIIGLSYLNVCAQTSISSVDELKKIGNDAAYPMSGSYFLVNDIEIPEETEWIPIGATGTTDASPTPFSGELDGNGYSIKNLKITTGGDLKGLFGTLTNATVTNLTLEVDININKRQVGAVAGSMQGETLIERVAVRGSIEGLENVGGIVGRVQTDNNYPYYNKIRNCYVNATVKSQTMQAGGIVGRANGALQVEKIYMTGKVEAAATDANQNAAGIVAMIFSNNFVQLRSCVIMPAEIIGGTPNLFYSNEAKRYPEYFEDLYARNDISLVYKNPDAKGGGAQIVKESMLLSPESFKEQSFYENTLLWDFDNVWRIGNDGYPELRNTTAPEVARTKDKIKIACIGNSITENTEVDYSLKYPSQLQERLGTDKYAVRNYGTGGTCMLKDGDNSFWKLPRLTSALNWSPDIVIIKMGTNDTKDANWAKIAAFEQDYLDFIDQFKTVNPDVKVYVCYPLPAYNIAGKNERITELMGTIDAIAQKSGATVIDLNTAFIGRESTYYVADKLHPNATGTTIMATLVSDKINADYWSENPVAISTVDELKKIGNDDAYPLNGSYYLANDIEIPEETEWIPIGARSAADGDPRHFTGVLDGKGYSIKNLKISTTGTNVKGLFGRLGHAVVKDLSLENVDIKAKETVGAVAGAMFGESKIQRVSVSGNIEGTTVVGGIVGRIPHNQNYTGYNVIEDCFVTANVTATSQSTNMNAPSVAGGIAAFSVGNVDGNYGKIDIRRVYVTGKIISTQKTNAAGNSAGILPFYDSHNFVKMEEVIVLSEAIESATPNLFFSRRGPTYDQFELFDKVYARTGIELIYLSDGDKGRGGEIPEGIINYKAVDEFKTKQFYTDNLTWDFENVWTIAAGEYPVLIDAAIRSDATLASLEVAGHTLTPSFNAATFQYEVSVANEVTSVTINAIPGFEGATIAGDGEKTLNEGDNPFNIVVTAKDGRTKLTYKVTVKRAEELSNDATLSNLEVTGGMLDPLFAPNVFEYTVNVPSSTTKVTITATKNEEHATIEGDGEKTLTSDEDKFTVKVTAQNGTIRNYEITVKKGPGTDLQDTNGSSVYIYAKDNVLHITSAEQAVIEIYSVSGQFIDQASNVYNYDVKLNKGLYIVRVNGKNYKVQVH